MRRVEKVATPATAATVAVPDRVPPPGLVPSAAVTLPLNPVAVLPSVSKAVTCTAGATVTPAVVLVGCTLNTNWLAVPAATLNAALGCVRRPVAAAVSVQPVPTLVTLRLENVATP